MILCKTNRILAIRNNLNMVKWRIANFINVCHYSNATNTQKRKEKKTRNVPFLSYNFRAEPKKLVSEDECQKYLSLCPDIIKDLTESQEDMLEVTERYTKLLQYNLPKNIKATGLTVLGAYKMFESAENLTPLNIHLANILGWCVDVLHCSYEMIDDIMDRSTTRYGVPSWYKIEGVGDQAINDSALIQHGPYILLKKYFSGHQCYFPCIEWLHEANIKTFMGQSLDNMNRLNGKPNLDTFTRKKYRCLVDYKGTYPQYLLPIKLAMFLANKYGFDLHKQLENILFELGEYFTAQNDILACYGNPLITGEVGSDILEGKCSWLVVTALERAIGPQRQLLNEHYGKRELKSELKVKQLYDELGILDLFLKYEEKSYHMIHKLIGQMPKNLPQEFFRKLVDTNYGRQSHGESGSTQC